MRHAFANAGTGSRPALGSVADKAQGSSCACRNNDVPCLRLGIIHPNDQPRLALSTVAFCIVFKTNKDGSMFGLL